MSYPRKRALLACDFCRQRKRRCDGKKPVCGNCTEAEADCHYQELPMQRLDSSMPSASMARRMERIEELLKSHSEAISALTRHVTVAPAPTILPEEHPDIAAYPLQSLSQIPNPSSNGANANSPADSRHSGTHGAPRSAGSPSYATDLPLFAIPQKHLTSTNSLLGLPTVKALVGEFPADFFFRLESQRLSPAGWVSGPKDLPFLNRDVTDLLVTTFFSVVHPCHPILDREEFFSLYEGVLANGLHLNLESALCLVVLALGVVASQPPGADTRNGDWAPGMEYFQPALQILVSESTCSFGSSLLLPQGLIFGGVYFAYLTQPLHSWKLIHLASTNTQLLFSSDRLAEFDLPRSGIETFVDDMAFPRAENPLDREKLCYMAEISIRRLLNRVHNTIYNAGERGSFSAKLGRSSLPMSVESLITITSELDRQLVIWYDSVPEIIKPTLGLDPTADDRERILRTRYYSTKHIIYRQFVLYLASLPEEVQPSPLLLEKAQLCIESCRLYLQNTGEILKKPSQYTWTLSQSSFGAILVLTVASLSRHLEHLVPDIFQLQQLLTQNIARWAAPDSSFESIGWILEDIRRKQRFHGV
ncbi:hypothetical protein FQN57_004242 [Myotisia sp. PD_48]|nr:hypothetical protein FQN57_004242 [Myotisia sp. PD_48]